MRSGTFSVLLCAIACGGSGSQGSTGVVQTPLQPSHVILTRASFAPGADRLAWVSGFSSEDVWIAPIAGGVLRTDGSGPPQALGELALTAVGGVLEHPVFLTTGDAFFRVPRGASGARLLHWRYGAVDDRTTDLVDGPEDFGRIVLETTTPAGDFVALVADRTDPHRIQVFSWNGSSFDRGAVLVVPGTFVTFQLAALAVDAVLLIGADATGRYSISRFNGAVLTTVSDAPGQLSGTFFPTSPTTGFLPINGLSFFDGATLRPAARPPASPVFLPFAPDGLLSIESDGSTRDYTNPHLFVQHKTLAGERFEIGNTATGATRHWMAAGLAGTSAVVVVDGVADSDPSIVSVELARAPTPGT